MSRFVAQWDPEEVLGIGKVSSGVTCLGHAYTKGRRCHWAINAENRAQAADLLSQISRMDVSSPRDKFKDCLEPLGRLLLCDLWQHQEQLPSVVRNWCNRIEGHRETIAEWDQVIHGDSGAVQEWTAKLEQSLLLGDVDETQKTVQLPDLAQQRERGFQARLKELETLNSDLIREVESLRTQLAHSANDPVHSEATPVTSPARTRQPSADSYATFTHQSSAEGDRQLPDGHSQNLSLRMHVQFELQSGSPATSQQPHPQTVSQTEHSLLGPSVIL